MPASPEAAPPDSTCAIRPGVPLSLRLTLGELALGRRDPSMQFTPDGRGVVRASRTPEGPVTLEILQRGGTVQAAAWGPGTDYALDRLPALLGLDDDPETLQVDHPRLRDAVRKSRGLRLCRTWGVAEVLVPAVLQQLVTGPEAKRAYTSIVRRFGEPAPGPHGLLLRPDPKTLAHRPWEEFVQLGATRANARTIGAVCTVPRRLEEILEMDAPAARARLTALPGIGPWTAAVVMGRALGFPDEVPVNDYHLPNWVAWFFERRPRSDDAEMVRLLEPYRGHRGRVIRLVESYGEGAPKFGPRHAIRRR